MKGATTAKILVNIQNAFNCTETQHQALTKYRKEALDVEHNSQMKSHQINPSFASSEGETHTRKLPCIPCS